ncbi:fasciclin domain-containing protein [Maribellus mangrovi]|uniref:fasciclin domain-containing protein n=1 Tax=Maribellus mangrovi TaxID=3133146 RepID=UPI0030EEF751
MKISKKNTTVSKHSLAKVRYKGLALLTIALAGLISVLPSCNSDDIGDNYYTFTGETVGQYITNRPENYSEFAKILEKTEVMGLLNSYGDYTCFLPDDIAMMRYYESKGASSVDDFTDEELKKIAYNHIIKDFEITSDQFAEGFLPNLTMSGRYLDISIETGTNNIIYRVNTDSEVLKKDIELHNGVVHAIDNAISPTENTLEEAISQDEKYSLFYEALVATGLNEKLTPIKDDSYDWTDFEDEDDIPYGAGWIITVPRERKYGFTALMESDATFAENEINNLDDLKAYAKQVYDAKYPEDASITDVTDRKNSLNRFVAYHLINKKLSSRLFIEKYDNTGRYNETDGTSHSVKIVDMFEYIEPMCPNTLIEVRTLRTTNEYNVFNMLESGEAIRLTDDFDNDALNGVYHEIDNILVYTNNVEQMLSTKRLRMDAASFFPEFTNNNMRVGHASIQKPAEQWYIPPGYADRLWISKTTRFYYYNPDDRFCDYQGDEIWMRGLYEFEATTPPIPAGTYEVRFGYQPTAYRGVAQLYWDGVPTGIPLDLRLYADNPKVGYERPGSNARDPEGFENDKAMRNRGYMKGPASFKAVQQGWYTGEPARMDVAVLRRILGIYTFTENTTHKFTVRGVISGEFMFDYLEFVPLEVLEYEDIY